MRFAVPALASIIAGSPFWGVDASSRSLGRRGDRDDDIPSSSSSGDAAKGQAGVFKKLKDRLVAPSKLENSVTSAEATAKKSVKCDLGGSKNREGKSSSDPLDFGALRVAADESLAGVDNGAGCPSKDQVCVDPYAMAGAMELYADAAEAEASSTEIRRGVCVDRESVPDSYWDLVPRDVDPSASLLYHREFGEEQQRRRSLFECGECPSRPLVDCKDGEYFARQLRRCIRAMNGTRKNMCEYQYNGEVVPVGCWDTSLVTNMSSAFYGVAFHDNFDADQIKCWDTSNVEDMSQMFYYVMDINPAVEDWDTSKVTDMTEMFYFASMFDRDLSNWNTENLKFMDGIFESSYTFKGAGLENWKTSKIASLDNSFYNATEFNGDLSNWKVDKVTSMVSTFAYATNFDPPPYQMENWNTAKVSDMSGVFYGAYKFNEPGIAKWDVSKVKFFEYAFAYAYKFNVQIDQWNVKKMKNATRMFQKAEVFHHCISTWADKSKNTFKNGKDGTALEMFSETACPKTEVAKSKWCGTGTKCKYIKKNQCKKKKGVLKGKLKKNVRCKCEDTASNCAAKKAENQCSANLKTCAKTCNNCLNF